MSKVYDCREIHAQGPGPGSGKCAKHVACIANPGWNDPLSSVIRVVLLTNVRSWSFQGSKGPTEFVQLVHNQKGPNSSSVLELLLTMGWRRLRRLLVGLLLSFSRPRR